MVQRKILRLDRNTVRSCQISAWTLVRSGFWVRTPRTQVAWILRISKLLSQLIVSYHIWHIQLCHFLGANLRHRSHSLGGACDDDAKSKTQKQPKTMHWVAATRPLGQLLAIYWVWPFFRHSCGSWVLLDSQL